jgi:hypothetical protein
MRAFFDHHLGGDPDFQQLMLPELVQKGQEEGVIRHGDPWIMAFGIGFWESEERHE